MSQRIAIFPGSFDPFTNGHYDVVRRGLALFDKVIISMGYNSNKTRYFDPQLMKKSISEAFTDTSAVEVIIYDELTATLAARYGARFLLRGLRNTTDFEFENSSSQMNQSLNQELETIFLITSPAYSGINSSLLREVHKYGGDVAPYLPYKLPV